MILLGKQMIETELKCINNKYKLFKIDPIGLATLNEPSLILYTL